MTDHAHEHRDGAPKPSRIPSAAWMSTRPPPSTAPTTPARPSISAAPAARRSSRPIRPAIWPAAARRPPPPLKAQSTPARCIREIRQVGPGSCPICGMALEPLNVDGRGGPEPRTRRHDAALLDRARADRAGVRAGDGRPSLPAIRHAARAAPVELDSTGAGDAGGALGRLAVLRARLGSLVTRSLNMFTLIAMGAGVAWAYSVVATAGAGPVPGRVPRPEAASPSISRRRRSITVLVLLGQVLELRAREQTSGRDPRAARPRAEDRPAR